MQKGQGFKQRRLTELFTKHWKIGAVMTLINGLVMLVLVFFLLGNGKFFVDGAFSLAQFTDVENLFFLIPLLFVFTQFIFCLIPTVKGFLNRNDAQINLGHERE